MSRILVTGVAGFIGQRTALRLLDMGHSVVGVDNLNDYYDVRLKQWRLKQLQERASFAFHQRDIEDLAALESLFSLARSDGRGGPDRPYDAVVNLAARAGVRYSIVDPMVYLRTNAQGTLHLLELMKRFRVPKMVLASTSSLYAGQPMPFSENLPVNEPISPYAASKKAAEVMAFTYHHLHDISTTVLRYFTVYGPAGRPDMSYFRFIRWVDEGRPILMYGDGSQSRDFTYIDDIVDGTVRALDLKGYQIINLGNSRPHKMLELVGLIECRLGKKAALDRRPIAPADMKDTWADIARAEELLGWKPKTGLEQGINRTIDWYVKNRAWVSQLDIDVSK